MPSPKTYRRIPVADLPDADWVAAQEVPDDVANVYDSWPERGAIEMSAVWWDESAAPAGVGAAVYDGADVAFQPVEIKHVPLPNGDVTVGGVHYTHYDVVEAATAAATGPAFVKLSLIDTSADAMYLRVATATAPVGATHLYIVAEVTR